ncbi:MAG TPA: tol-pal system protein YbgF [Dongiaceae bacterium]|jgi:tol-pal system protein YbgF
MMAIHTPSFRQIRSLAPALLLGALLCSGLAGATARADEVDDLRAQVDQLKSEVTLMQNQMPGTGSGGGSTGGGTVAAQQEVRLQQLSAQISQLQGEIEQVGIKVDDLTDKYTKFQKDTEYRLGAIEQGGAPGAVGGAAPAGTTMGGSPATPLTANGVGGAPATVEQNMPSVAGQPQPLVGPEGAPPPTQPGTLGTLPAGTVLPQAPAGAAEAAAAAAAQQTPVAAATQDPKSIVLPGSNPQEQYDYATGLLQRGAYAEAEIALKAFVAQHPSDALTGNAQYWLGESYYVRSDFKNAAVAFAEGYQKYPKSPKAPDNLLKLGMALGQIGQKDNACTAFKQLGKQFPNASAAIKDRATRAQQRYGCTG